MTILNVLKYPNKILKERADEIEDISEEIEILAHDMLETMYINRGIGLAANQVGILKRIIVIDLQESKREEEEENDDEDEDDDKIIYNPMIFINPEITWSSDETSERDEGCLSLPKVFENVKRPSKIKISYLDIDAKKQTLEAEGLLAICLQHEIDHLNGVLFIDRISKLKKELLLKKYKKSQENTK